MKVSELKSKLAAVNDDYEIEVWLKKDDYREMLCEISNVSAVRHSYVYPEPMVVDVVEVSICPGRESEK